MYHESQAFPREYRHLLRPARMSLSDYAIHSIRLPERYRRAEFPWYICRKEIPVARSNSSIRSTIQTIAVANTRMVPPKVEQYAIENRKSQI